MVWLLSMFLKFKFNIRILLSIFINFKFNFKISLSIFLERTDVGEDNDSRDRLSVAPFPLLVGTRTYRIVDYVCMSLHAGRGACHPLFFRL